MVGQAEAYEWSSARAHLGVGRPDRVVDIEYWREIGGVEFWRELLDRAELGEWRKDLRRATYAVRVMESKEFKEQAKRSIVD